MGSNEWCASNLKSQHHIALFTSILKPLGPDKVTKGSL